MPLLLCTSTLPLIGLKNSTTLSYQSWHIQSIYAMSDSVQENPLNKHLRRRQHFPGKPRLVSLLNYVL